MVSFCGIQDGIESSPESSKNGQSVSKSGHLSGAEKKLRNLKPFAKGFDPNRNLKGRPRTFDQCRALAQEIAHEELSFPDGRKLTVAEAVLRAWAKSKEPQLQKAFIEYAFGKVPDKIDATMEHRSKLYLNYSHEESNAREDRSRLPASIPPGAN